MLAIQRDEFGYRRYFGLRRRVPERRHIADTEQHCLRQVVNFNEGIARGIIDSTYDGGVAPRLQRGDDG
jgi:hypothetical protein